VDGNAIPYADLEGFPHAGVSGHSADLVVGQLEGQRVAVFGGRAHYYESGDPAAMRLPLETLKALGAGILILTNAAGSLRADMPTGSIMCLSDHINFSGLNPLIGEKTDARFVPMTQAYDPDLRARLHASARAADTDMFDGVYAWYSGPSFETPAEIRAIRTLGADAVGMSTVPEVIVARHAGIPVAAISAITNLAVGMSADPVDHEQTLRGAAMAAADLTRLVRAFIASFAGEA
jgi:purine-nucleoside phosphorylase